MAKDEYEEPHVDDAEDDPKELRDNDEISDSEEGFIEGFENDFEDDEEEEKEEVDIET